MEGRDGGGGEYVRKYEGRVGGQDSGLEGEPIRKGSYVGGSVYALHPCEGSKLGISSGGGLVLTDWQDVKYTLL